jgi:hypothetical protein
MLKRFLYLDTVALSGYLSAIEGGIAVDRMTRDLRKTSGQGGVDAKVITARGERGSEIEESRSYADSDSARFDRLLAAADADQEGLGWIEANDPDTEFPLAGVGAMVSWECEFSVHPLTEAFSKHGEFSTMLDMAGQLESVADALGLDMAGMPEKRDRETMKNLIRGIDSPRVFLGESDETDWKLICPAKEVYLEEMIEGPARIVGKVVKSLKAGEWKPVVTLPGMNLLSREERRKRDRTPPEAGHEGEYIQGPALIVEVLAIYR